MSFKSHPDPPELKSEAEKTVYGLLVDQLPDNADVFCNIEYFNGTERRELDFLISIPEVGLVALEVKGGLVKEEDQRWWIWDAQIAQFKVIPLADQVDAERRLVRDRLRFKISQLPAFTIFVVLPDTELDENVQTHTIIRKNIIAKNDLERLYQKALCELRTAEKNFGYSEASQEIVRREFGVTSNDYSHVVETAQARSGLVDQMSAKQMYLLELMQDNPRILIKGGPGSGKTILAIEHALNLAEQKLRVGLICYNRGLGKWLEYSVDQMKDRKKPALIGNFFDTLAGRWLPEMSVPTENVDLYYSETLPNALLEHTKSLQDHQKFDAWIVDEAQDLKPIHWQILREALRDPENGVIHAFGDNEQNLFSDGMELPWFHAIGRLNDNLRSSKSIARILKSLSENSGDPKGPLIGTAPEIVYIESQNQAEAVAEQVVEQLVESYGWRRGDIAVITTRKLHTKQKAAVDADLDAYWEEFFAQTDVMYTNVNSFKGLERPVVVFAVNGIPQDVDARQRFYIGFSRARDDLVLVGTREDLRYISEVLASFNVINV